MPLSPEEQQELAGLQKDPHISGNLSPEEQAELHSLTGGSWLDTKLPFNTTPRGFIQGTANALPMVGGVAGGIGGTLVEPGGGSLVGAGLGGGAGAAMKNMIETGVLGKDKSREDTQKELASGMSTAIAGEGVGQAAPIALKAAGTTAYNSGIKPLMETAEKYNLGDVGQFLRDNNIWGRAKSIANDAWDLAEKKLGSRDATLAQAGEAGGTTSMANSVKPVEDYVSQIRASRNPDLQALADMMEKKAQSYKALDASPGDIASLPSRGVTPAEASGYKTTVSNEINPRYRNMSSPPLTPESVRMNKTLAGGLQKETENSVSEALGPEYGSQLHSDNSDLGKLLSIAPVAEKMAGRAGRVNNVTSMDAAILGSGNPYMAALKKAADLAKTTGIRTSTGYGLTKAAASPWTPLLSNIATQEGAQ